MLETRDLMAFTSLGFSLPNLIVSGQVSQTAAWKGPLGITATVQNIGTSTTTEPISQAPGDTSSADAPSSTVTVFLTQHKHSNAGAVDIGTLTIPALAQNSLEQVSGTLTLPSIPAGFNASKGHYFIRLVANGTSTVAEGNVKMNVSKPIPVTIIGTALPEVVSPALYVPPTMQPGDTIAPVIDLANIGTADTSTQGTLQVALVASTTPDFNLGSSIIQLFKIPNIPVSTAAGTTSSVLTNATGVEIGTLTTGGNTAVITASPVTLPASPNGYYIGVVVDPYGVFDELSEPSNLLEVIHVVGPAINGLPPAGLVSAPLTYAFPNSASGSIVGVSNGSSSTIG
jgi:hypothetical protein